MAPKRLWSFVVVTRASLTSGLVPHTSLFILIPFILRLMKLLVLFSVLSALVAMAAALSPYRYAIYPNSTACGTLRQRTCKGNLICSSFIYSGPCCGGCSGGSCGVCSAGYACIGGNCTSSYPISTSFTRVYFSSQYSYILSN